LGPKTDNGRVCAEPPTEHEIERRYRDAPMLLIGEGTAEIQKMIIGRALVRDYEVKP
jgi:alkylation response protein AidB-like acyl-CoA dehydrogenase